PALSRPAPSGVRRRPTPSTNHVTPSGVHCAPKVWNPSEKSGPVKPPWLSRWPPSSQWTVNLAVFEASPLTSTTSISGGHDSSLGLPQKALRDPAQRAVRIRASQYPYCWANLFFELTHPTENGSPPPGRRSIRWARNPPLTTFSAGSQTP